ncbi:MAG: ABC transporter substrate-binding protein [Desulfobacteraceae bacterium]|nr:ABC transporter substrate-binding protein [Desulfobacteraceae bacterium]
MRQIKKNAVLFVLLSAFLFSGLCYASTPTDEMKSTINSILETLRDPALQGEQNTEKRRLTLRKIVNNRFQYLKMSQLCLARHWKGRNGQEKEAFVTLFSQLLETTYITKIEAYTDEEVVFVKERIKKKKAQVDTKIITSSVEIPINYRLYMDKSGKWMVYDIVIEGVSLVGNYRSQFSQILEKNSFEKLMEKLKNKI